MPDMKTPAIDCLIFDLNDTLVRGLSGVEETLTGMVGTKKDDILSCLRDDEMLPFLLGQSSKDAYLRAIITKHSWDLELAVLKSVVRKNFDRVISGMDVLVQDLSRVYPLFLLSDQGREWAEYVEERHAFIRLFRQKFYSFAMGRRKTEIDTYRSVLDLIGYAAERCLFIDDRERFVRQAEAAGMQAIVFHDSGQLREELRRKGINAVGEVVG